MVPPVRSTRETLVWKGGILNCQRKTGRQVASNACGQNALKPGVAGLRVADKFTGNQLRGRGGFPFFFYSGLQFLVQLGSRHVQARIQGKYLYLIQRDY